MDLLDQTIASNLIRLRLAKGWSQSELARHSGVTQPQISQLEGRLRGVGPDSRKKLAEALGVDVQELWATPPASPDGPAEDRQVGYLDSAP